MSTTTWTPGELRRIGDAAELRIASRRPDGTLRPYVTIWTATTGDGVHVRSGHGADNPWFRRAVAAGRGRIQAGGVERDVEFVRLAPDAAAHADIDAVYHAKYDHHGATVVGTVTGAHATHVTLRLHPLD